MRILAVTPYYEPEGGGLERYAHAILRRLAARGHEVMAMSMTHGAAAEEIRDGVHVQRIPAAIRIGNTPVHPAFYRHVRGAIRASRPDIVVGHAPVPFSAEMAFFAASGESTPFVLTFHAGQLHGSNPLLELVASLDRATLQRRMVQGSSGLIGVSSYVRRHALSGRLRDVHVVPPGVDLTRFHSSRAPARPHILFVGPLDGSYRWKGIDVLMDAFQIVRRGIPEARLTLVGSGNRVPELRFRAEEEGGDIRFRGRLDDFALDGAYKDCSMVVLPSTTDAEAFGMVLAEANASGRPVIGSDIGGIPEFVKPGRNGLLARPGDPRDLARNILRLLSDPTEAARMGRAGRRHVARNHNWDRLTETTEAVLAMAAAPRR